MADTSSILSLPYLQANQAQKHVTHNEALRILEALTQLSVIVDDLTVPPSGAQDGDRYVVGGGATDDWAGHDNCVAVADGDGWFFLQPKTGWRAYVSDRDVLIIYNGADWVELNDPVLQGIDRFGLGMQATPSSPFSAKLNAGLWTALYALDGGTGSMVQTLNREASGDDLGFVFQQNFQTRALFGLFGTDDLRLATSSDGVNFRDGLIINNPTGIVEQPNLPRFKAHTSFDNYSAPDVWTKLAINVSEYNEQGIFDASTNTFTTPVTGSYLLGATLVFGQNTSDQARIGGRFIVNGIDVVKGGMGEATGTHIDQQTSVNLQTMVMLNAGDTVTLEGIMRGFDGYFLSNHTSFWGLKIG